MHNDSMYAKLNAGDRTAGLARRRLWPRDKLQPETCSLPLRGPSTRQRYLPALCSSVMAFAPSSTQAVFVSLGSRGIRATYPVKSNPRVANVPSRTLQAGVKWFRDAPWSLFIGGSTPVLKIALPSSPLPEHLSRPSTRRLAPFRALSSELGSMGSNRLSSAGICYASHHAISNEVVKCS